MSTEPLVQTSPEQRFLSYVQSGNVAILHALIQEYADRLYTQARRIIGRDDGAEDAVQEAYLLLVRTASRYDGSVPFAAWISRLVTSSAINYRNRMHRHRNFGDLADRGANVMKDNEIPTNVDEKDIEALRIALDSLPDRYRTPLTMYYFAGLNQNETAQALGAPADRIAKQLSRGVEKLRVILGRAGFAMTSAGIVTMITSLPTYAASPALKASLVGSERLLAAGHHISRGILKVGKITTAKGVGIIQGGVIATLVTGATVVVAQHGVPGPQMTPIPPKQELIAHWTFDEGRGTTVKNNVGTDDVGTLVNGPVWSKGETGGRLNFDGIDDYVRVEHRDGLNSDSLTVSLRFMVSSQVDFSPVLIQKMAWLDSNGWVLSLDNRNELNMTWETAKNKTFYRASSPMVLQEKTMYAVAGTYSEGMLRLYINGILQAVVPGELGRTSDPLFMGCEDGYRSGETPHMLNGCIEDVRIYNRALSDSEIADLSR